MWLFDRGLWPDAVRSGNATARLREGIPAPKELANWDAAKRAFTWDDDKKAFKGLDPEKPRLVARVWLEDSTSRRAEAHARRVLQSLIDLAKSDSGWVLLDGAAVWRENVGWSHQGFQDPSVTAAATAPHPVHDRTAANLEALDGEFVRRLLDREAISVEAMDDALWSVAVDRAPTPSQRIMLAIRAVERTLGPAREERNDTWAKAAAR